IVVAVMQNAGVGTGSDDRWIGDRLCAAMKKFMDQLGFDLIFVPTRTSGAHGTPMSVAGDLSCATDELELMRILDQTHRGQWRPNIDDGRRRRDARPYAAAYFVEQRRYGVIPRGIEADRGEQRGLIGHPIGELGRQLADGVGLVEREYLPCCFRPITKAIPDFALGVLVATEQD